MIADKTEIFPMAETIIIVEYKIIAR